MRSRMAIINTIAGLSYELVSVICGFILPRLILSVFGSDYNGIVSSITQFLGYASLMRAGIGGVMRAALYKPLAERDMEGISAIVNATNHFFRRVALIFAASIIVLAAIYPFFVSKNFDWVFSFTLILIIGITTFAQYYFGLTYQYLLTADQRQGIIYIVQIGTTILSTVLAYMLIKGGWGIHGVKLGSALAYSLNPIILSFYAKKKYRINKSLTPNNKALDGKWDCFGLQVANFVNSNTDMIILTVFSSVYEVSVYTVYYMVTSGIRKLLLTFVNSISAAFGNMFAKGERIAICNNLKLYEQITFALTTILYSTTYIMIISFVTLYTDGITDVNYLRPAFALVLILASMFSCFRIPYQSIVEVVGHFKQTRNGALFEAGMNIVVSVILVIKLGLVGVAIGTLCATVFRTFQYAIYMSRFIIERSIFIVIKRVAMALIEFAVILVFFSIIRIQEAVTYNQFAIQVLVVCIISGAVVFLFEAVFYRSDLMESLRKIKRVFNGLQEKDDMVNN